MLEQTKESLVRFMEDTEHLPVPGKALLICKGNKEVFRHYQGEVRPETIYRVHSMTKLFTVTAAFQLFEKGLFLMEDPVSLYLPEYEHVTVWDEELGAPRAPKTMLKMRHLFSMTGGFTYEGDSCETERRTAQLEQRLDREYPGKTFTLRQYVRELASVPLAFDPGAHYRYSHGHDVLGAIVEELSGEKLGDYFRHHIFHPLGMKDTFFRCPADRRKDLASYNADWWPDDYYDESARFEQAGGGLLSTLDDYMTFAKVLTLGGTSEQGVQILGRKTLELMATDQLNETQKQDFYLEFMKGYSYGFGVRTYVDPALGGCPGSVGEFGWCGTGGTYVLCDPKQQLTLVYMHQNDPKLEEYLQPRLRAILYSDSQLAR